MNSLSWMLYAADISDSLGTGFGMLGFFGTLVILGLSGFLFMVAEAPPKDASMKDFWRKPLRWLPVTFLMLLVAGFVPSERTIYMIAASEAGEAVVTSADGQAMLSDVKDLIRKKLAEELQEGGGR